jgi:hypothetical protein
VRIVIFIQTWMDFELPSSGPKLLKSLSKHEEDSTHRGHPDFLALSLHLNTVIVVTTEATAVMSPASHRTLKI